MARSAFKFRMQRLLDVRVMREKLAQSELLKLRNKLAQEEDKLALLIQKNSDLRAEQAIPLQRGEDLQDFAQRRSWLEKVIIENNKAQETQKGAIKRAEQAVAAQKEVVKQRGIDVKALEKVKDNQREAHTEEQLREEGLFLDDLSGQGYMRQRRVAERIALEDAEAYAKEGKGARS